jgi:uncharacterized membrane-anchored protein
MVRSISFVIAFAWLAITSAVLAQENPISKLAWQRGPGEGVIGDKAKIRIPEGYLFLNAAETKKFMDLTHNLSSGREYLFAPADFSWWSVFEFNPVGYVKDDEKVDAAAVLDSVKRGTEQANEEKRKRGWNTMSIVGWRFEPQYDRNSKLLEWAFLARDDQSNTPIVNYNTRLLGRTGVMQVILVAEPNGLDSSVASFKRVATSSYEFLPGERYAEFRAGDHVAEFGLAALIAGGAAAVATKKGFWAVIGGFLAAAWKFIAAAVVALVAGLGKIFKKKPE